MNEELETKCEKCDGTGGETSFYGRWNPCFKCDGAGYIPTEMGKRVLLLFKHHCRITGNFDFTAGQP